MNFTVSPGVVVVLQVVRENDPFVCIGCGCEGWCVDNVWCFCDDNFQDKGAHIIQESGGVDKVSRKYNRC